MNILTSEKELFFCAQLLNKHCFLAMLGNMLQSAPFRCNSTRLLHNKRILKILAHPS